jgi:glyoxylase-like metal-dependent hydrolase (beta-lactamase superfamily II)
MAVITRTREDRMASNKGDASAGDSAKWCGIVTAVAIAGLAGACGAAALPAKAAPPAKAALLDTANTVSLDPEAPNSFRTFAPELDTTVARMPRLDPQTGLHVSEVKPNLFYVTDGVYQAAFVRTGEGIIVFDAPPSFAQFPGVIAAHSSGEPVKFLLYSHGHTDHIGGSVAFGGVQGLKVVAPLEVAQAIERANHPDILKPNVTFEQDKYSLSLGREVIEIKTGHFHSENTDTIIYLPRQKFVIAVDTITPGEAPFMNFGATAKFAGYVDFFDEILKYDFDTILSGHVSILGTRDDLVVARDYVHDVRDTALKGMASMLPTFEKVYTDFDHKNGNLAYRVAIETVRRGCATQIIDRWKGKLSVVDVWADSHCETVILHAIMH